MHYVSVDVETTGRDHEFCQVIEFAAVSDDLCASMPPPSVVGVPFFHRYLSHPVYTGEPRALAMHARIFDILAQAEEEPERAKELGVIPVKDLAHQFAKWLKALGFPEEKGRRVIVVAGKNAGNFDLNFLRKLPSWGKLIRVRHRVADPAMLYFDPFTMGAPPGLADCLKAAGLEPSGLHTALGDARDVVRLLRHHYFHDSEGRAVRQRLRAVPLPEGKESA